jgi:hypothetical protein
VRAAPLDRRRLLSGVASSPCVAGRSLDRPGSGGPSGPYREVGRRAECGTMNSAPQFGEDLYRGTAQYYDRYRVRCPTQLIDDLVTRASVSGTGRLLDGMRAR